MKYIVLVLAMVAMGCEKGSSDIVGTWNLEKVTWDGGEQTDNLNTSFTFTDNGNILENGAQKWTYIADGAYITINGKETKYRYELKRKSMVIYGWYFDNSSPVNYPNLKLYLSK